MFSKTLGITILALASVVARAEQNPEGGISGGGGKVARQISTGQVELYDFVEAGLEDQTSLPALPPTNLVPKNEVERLRGVVERTLKPLSRLQGHESTVDLVVRTFANLQTASPILSDSLESNLTTLTWRTVDMSLVETRDVGRTPVRLNDDWELLQAAFRNDQARSVTFDRSLVGALSPLDRTGLIFHELYYSLEVAIAGAGHRNLPERGYLKELQRRGSSDARALVALTFSPPLNLKVASSILKAFPGINTDHDIFKQLAYPKETKDCLRWRNGERAAAIERAWPEYSRLSKIAETRMLAIKAQLGPRVHSVDTRHAPVTREEFLANPHRDVTSYAINTKARNPFVNGLESTYAKASDEEQAPYKKRIERITDQSRTCQSLSIE